jgi:hypothetical protein
MGLVCDASIGHNLWLGISQIKFFINVKRTIGHLGPNCVTVFVCVSHRRLLNVLHGDTALNGSVVWYFLEIWSVLRIPHIPGLFKTFFINLALNLSWC